MSRWLHDICVSLSLYITLAFCMSFTTRNKRSYLFVKWEYSFMNSCFKSCLFFITFRHARCAKSFYHSISLKYHVPVHVDIVHHIRPVCVSVIQSFLMCFLFVVQYISTGDGENIRYLFVLWSALEVNPGKIHRFSLFSVKYMLFLKGQFASKSQKLFLCEHVWTFVCFEQN